MSVLGLKSGYTVKYGLSPRDPLGSGHTLPYIPSLVLIRIQSDDIFDEASQNIQVQSDITLNAQSSTDPLNFHYFVWLS